MPRRIDENIFRNTALKTRKLNIMRYIPRGGICL